MSDRAYLEIYQKQAAKRLPRQHDAAVGLSCHRIPMVWHALFDHDECITSEQERVWAQSVGNARRRLHDWLGTFPRLLTEGTHTKLLEQHPERTVGWRGVRYLVDFFESDEYAMFVNLLSRDWDNDDRIRLNWTSRARSAADRDEVVSINKAVNEIIRLLKASRYDLIAPLIEKLNPSLAQIRFLEGWRVRKWLVVAGAERFAMARYILTDHEASADDALSG